MVPCFLQAHNAAMIESCYESVQGIEAEKLFELFGDVDETLYLSSTCARRLVVKDLRSNPCRHLVPVVDPVVQMLSEEVVLRILCGGSEVTG